MPLRIRCPNGHKLIVPDDRAGRSLRCPRCGEVTQVPADEVGQASRLPSKDEFGERSPAPQLAEASASSQPVATSSSSASSSGVLDWPNSIVAPTTVAALEEPIPPPEILLEPPPLPPESPPPRSNPSAPKPVVKPKSRALPLSTAPPTPPPELRTAPEPIPPIAESPAPEVVTPEARPIVDEPTVGEPDVNEAAVNGAMPISQPAGKSVFAEKDSWDRSAQEAHAADDREGEVAPPPVTIPSSPPIPAAAAAPLGTDRGNTWAAYQLAAALIVAALFSIAPAVWDVVEYAQFPESQFVARWALVLFLLGVVQVAYAAFLVQLPDWTSVWVVTVYSLLLAAIYAAVLGLVLLSDEAGIVVAALQLSDKLAGGKAVLWCLSMVSISTILAFFAGRLSARWHRMEGTLRGAGL